MGKTMEFESYLLHGNFKLFGVTIFDLYFPLESYRPITF